MRFTAFQHHAAAVGFHHSLRIQKQPDGRPPHLRSKCLEVAFKQTTMCVCMSTEFLLAQLNRCIDEYGCSELKAVAAAVVHRATFCTRQNELYVYL